MVLLFVYILDFPLFQDFSYNLYYYSVSVVLVRSAPTTFHIVDVDDFTSINMTRRHVSASRLDFLVDFLVRFYFRIEHIIFFLIWVFSFFGKVYFKNILR
jgi:hypothetical protein